MACSHHIDDRVSILQKNGICLTLLTSSCVKKTKLARHIRIPCFSPSGIRFELRHVLRRGKYTAFKYKLLELLLFLPVLPFYLAEKLLYRIDTTWWWCVSAYLRGCLDFVSNKYDVIYSTGGPISAHLAAIMLGKMTSTPVVAEFQDPLIHSYCARSSFELKLTKWAEKMICTHAHRVVFLTSKALDNTFARTGNNNNGTVVYPGSVPIPAKEGIKQTSNLLHFVHLGTLGGSRNLSSLLEALQLLVADSIELRHKVRISLFGRIDAAVEQQIKLFPYSEMVLIHGQVTREQSLNEMRTCDVLLLIQNKDDISSETIPSKVYEYFHAGRPILGLLYNNPELTNMFKQLKHFPVQLDDINAVKDAITTLLSLWKLGELSSSKPESPYTVENAVVRLINEVAEVI